jgi:hypothetical protein
LSIAQYNRNRDRTFLQEPTQEISTQESSVTIRGEEAALTLQSSAQEVKGPPEVKISEELIVMLEAELNQYITCAQEELRL